MTNNTPSNYDEAKILYRSRLAAERRICSQAESQDQEKLLLDASTLTNEAIRMMANFRPSMMVG